MWWGLPGRRRHAPGHRDRAHVFARDHSTNDLTSRLREGPLTLPLTKTHVKMPLFAFPDAERCESGRIDMLGKHASRQRDRGFESHPLRHILYPIREGKRVNSVS